MVSYYIYVAFLAITLDMNNSYIIKVEWKMHKNRNPWAPELDIEILEPCM